MGEMTDEEYYKCFEVPKELVDDMLEIIADAAAFAMNRRIMPMVKEEVGAHPNLDVLCKYYEDLSQTSAKKIGERMMKTTVEASEHATKMKKQERKSGWQVDK